jgi:hypothetical protein
MTPGSLDPLNRPLISICGDSFASRDPEWPKFSWVDRIQNYLSTDIDLRIHARPGCSNFYIRQQIDQAVQIKSDYIIYLATSSIRNDVCFGRPWDRPLIERYWNLEDPLSLDQRDLVSFSWTCIEQYPFDPEQAEFLKRYFAMFYDMDVAIKQNYYMIESCLGALEDYSTNWIWSQSGFEHGSFPGVEPQNFPARWRAKEASINIWDFWERNSRAERPYFHIQDEHVHEQVAKYYAEQIQHTLGIE